jgi:hypothetical protein
VCLNEGQCEPALPVILADSLTHERSCSVDQFQTCNCEPVFANNSESLLVSLRPQMQEPLVRFLVF